LPKLEKLLAIFVALGFSSLHGKVRSRNLSASICVRRTMAHKTPPVAPANRLISLFFRQRVRQIFHVNWKIYLMLGLLTALGFLPAQAADKIILQVGNATISAYHTADLESAKKEAAAAHQPIAWIASVTKVLGEQGTIAGANGRGATFHAFYALRNRAVLVFEDAYEENHRVLPLVDTALHTPDQHYTPPKVIFLNPDATEVLATVEYEPDFQKRARALADALAQVDAKMKSMLAAPRN
jgi:hypothetical protein